MEAVVERENMRQALKRVVTNKGAPGVDGMRVEELIPYLQEKRESIKELLLHGDYIPSPVLSVEIPKAGGKGTRMLGIPTVTDRLIQQAILQVLTPIFDPTFSESSYGFRPGRSAHQAVLKARFYANIYVSTETAAERVMKSITRFLGKRLKLKVNTSKSATDRPWKRKFLGYSMTWHKIPRLKVAPEAIAHFRSKVKDICRRGRGCSLDKTINELTPLLRGWVNYF